MEDTAKMDPTSIEFCERRIEQLKSQKRKLEMTTTKNLSEQADPKDGKERCEEVRSLLERKVKNPETQKKKMARQADQEDAKKHAKAIDSLEKTIRFMEKRKACLILAMERSISVEDAQELVEQEEKLKLKDEEQPAGEVSPESTTTEALPLPPPIHRHRPYPDGCSSEEHQEWMQEYTRVQDFNAPTDNLPTQTGGHKDPATVAAVVDPDEKSKLIDVAKSVVKVSFTIPNRGRENSDQLSTGIIISWDVDNKTAMILTGGCFGHDSDYKPKCKIFVHYPYMEDDGLIEAKLLFFSKFYQFSLLEVAFQGMLLDVPTQTPRFGSTHPKPGDEVFSLGRDKDLSLVVRRGTIMEEGCLIWLRQGYLFLDCKLPKGGTGGPVVDHQGDVVGLAMACDDGLGVILPITIALSCFHMWTNFRRIARPLLGMSCRTAEPLDFPSGDTRCDALFVTEVYPNSAAWKQGIRSGNVIVSFDEQPPKPVLEFEVFLLSLGSKHLHGTHPEVDFKLEVQDSDNVQRSITLHVPFSDVANVQG